MQMYIQCSFLELVFLWIVHLALIKIGQAQKGN